MRVFSRPRFGTSTALFLLAGLVLQAQPQRRPDQESQEAVPQPISFSHRQHSEMGMKCRFCHSSARSQTRAGLPESATCMVCHAKLAAGSPDLERLVEFHRSQQPIPWVRYYALTPDTFFSHRYHLAAGGRCEDCHGQVEKKDTLAAQKPLSMAECVGCHLSDGVPTDCGFCHTPGLASRQVPTERKP